MDAGTDFRPYGFPSEFARHKPDLGVIRDVLRARRLEAPLRGWPENEIGTQKTKSGRVKSSGLRSVIGALVSWDGTLRRCLLREPPSFRRTFEQGANGQTRGSP